MTADLPCPGTIWNRLPRVPYGPVCPMRVIFSDAHDVVAHNCEMAECVKPWSWRGTADEFAREFQANVRRGGEAMAATASSTAPAPLTRAA